ncbi:sugar transferase [Tautonia rosea]|uniref:sugar transferase n=1 Tax=Tautonia rosea TaxID=2728037 RepID=UPI00147504BB|nr:sugar transferase [Tautonia rosea]
MKNDDAQKSNVFEIRSSEFDTIQVPSAGWYQVFRRLLDVVLTLLLLIPAIPIMLVAMLGVRLTSRGPVIYTQTRLGQGGRPFTIYKIRTMYDRCEDETGPRWSDVRGDVRVTPIGVYLRKLKIDELPQIWNVFRGEMSLVGPRPERPEIVATLEEVIPHYGQRLLVRPGLTGLAQVQLPPDTDLESVRRKLACDLYYIQHVSLAMDLGILLGTANYLAGVPFWVSKTLLRVPSQEIAERSYRGLVESTPEPHPA